HIGGPAVPLPANQTELRAGKVAVGATPPDEDKKSGDGMLTFVDNVVDAATDTIKLKATFTNSDHRLWPGQFARVSLRLTTLSGATVVPQQAVQTGPDGQFIFVVSNDEGGRARRGNRNGGRNDGCNRGQGGGGAQPAAAAGQK